MIQVYVTDAQKRPYVTPALDITCSEPEQMLASSDPIVRTTSEKANTEYDALVKEENDTWDFEW